MCRCPQGQGERFDVLYRMEIISVLRSTSRVQPGETVTVRSYGLGKEARERGWIGTAYLNRDPKASGPGRRTPVRDRRTRQQLGGSPPGAPVPDVHPEGPGGRPMSCQPLWGLIEPAPRPGSRPVDAGALRGSSSNGTNSWCFRRAL